ncbi:mRNA-decapping enzyme 1A isoform X1 [Brienomyrus brachyistius]|uniref:mRNA-decapping enzyme 1A isoform X1 n=1 Tax=Brienomyrus brachyistius TaxID=42636 RepID=UPI0020B274F9|nr:mRNA-decapping enzyme 1A isoform X1 [Brienomyrus brachyistius]
MEAISKAGHHMSLAALQQHDPYINKIVDVTGQVALYTFNSKTNEWEKTDIEGTLFVYTRSASPYHGFTIMNRLSMENLVEPINKDLEFQLQDPFLLYRNSNLAIYSIWFYDKNDCQRIAQLMARVVKQEALQAQQPPQDCSTLSRTNGCVVERPIDILELLSKAKEEYQRGRVCESDLLSSELVANHDLPRTAVEQAAAIPQHEKNSHSGVKQITVEELFGSSLPKEQPPLGFTNQGMAEKGKRDCLGHTLPLEAPLVPHLHTDPGGGRLGTTSALANAEQHLGSTEAKTTPSYPLRPSPVFHSGGPGDTCAQPISPHLVGLPSPKPAASVTRPTQLTSGTSAYLPQEVVGQLKVDALPSAALNKPPLAPSFLPSLLATPECFREPVVKAAPYSTTLAAPGQNKDVDIFMQPQSLVKTIPGVSLKAGPAVTEAVPSLLLSPSVFQNSAKTPEMERKPAAPSPTSLRASELSTHLSRLQLQDTLIHLIKNDSTFLSTIHEAYLQSVAKNLNNVKL